MDLYLYYHYWQFIAIQTASSFFSTMTFDGCAFHELLCQRSYQRDLVPLMV